MTALITASMTGPMVAALAAGGIGALLYLWRRRPIDAVLVLVAGAALAATIALPPAPRPAGTATLATERRDAALQAALLAVPAARQVSVEGHGLREAEWRDVPPRLLAWSAPAQDVLALDFERTVPLGRAFGLAVTRSRPQPGWRLQLLAENGAVLDEAVARDAAARLSVTWVPPVAEYLVLRARLLDAAGKIIHEGPVPLHVVAPVPLQVIGRFGAPSFDTRTLNALLAGSGAILDWQTVLGKDIARVERAREPLASPHLLVIDAAWFEAHPAGRAALLARVAQGVPLLVLGGNARDPAAWRPLRLTLAAQSATTEKEDTRHVDAGGTRLAVPPASFNPVQWPVLARDADGKPWLWQQPSERDSQGGRILWLGVAEWHRHAITAPAALGQWWQQVLDLAATPARRQVAWHLPDPMPVPGLRTEVCAYGVKPGEVVAVDGQALRWQARSDRACAAWWPRRAGWTEVHADGEAMQLYVYSDRDWPAWQAGLRQAATARQAARYLPGSTAPAAPDTPPPPGWPFALLCAGALLGLWWRERR